MKIKTQELRKQRADTANSKLELDKMSKEYEQIKKKVEELETAAEEKKVAEKALDEMKQKYYKLCEESEMKESQLEAKVTETEVLKETLEQMKNFAPKKVSDEDNEGWDCEDDSKFNIKIIKIYILINSFIFSQSRCDEHHGQCRIKSRTSQGSRGLRKIVRATHGGRVEPGRVRGEVERF